MEIEQIKERFFKVVADGLTHKHYKHTVKKAKLYRKLITGDGLDSLLKQYARREDEKLFKQRVELTNHIVTSLSKNLLDVWFKIPRSNAMRRIISYKEETKKSNAEDVEKILAGFWGDESWDDYMATRFFELNAIDPNSFVIDEFKPFDHERQMVQPYPFESSSAMSVDYLYENKILQYLIVKDEYELPVPEDIAKLNNKTSKEAKKGDKYTLYAKDQTYQLFEIESSSPATEYELTLSGKDQIVKLGSKVFSYVEHLPHNLNEVPAFRVGINRDPETDGETYVNLLHAVEPYLLKTIKTNSELDLVATILAHPQLRMYAQPCVDTRCHNGFYDDNTICKTCDGTGHRPIATSAQDAIVYKLPKSKEELIPLKELMDFLHFPVDTAKWQEEYLEKLTVKAKRILFNSDIFDRKQIADTATGKNLDMSNVYDTLYPAALKYAKCWRKGVIVKAKLADREEGLVVLMSFGKDFKFKTVDMLISDLQLAKNIGNQALTRHLNDDIAQIIFADKPTELQRYNTRQTHNPFSGKTDDEIKMLMISDLVTREDKVIYANFGNILDLIELEGGENFYKLNRVEQKKRIKEKALEIIERIDAERPEPVLELK